MVWRASDGTASEPTIDDAAVLEVLNRWQHKHWYGVFRYYDTAAFVAAGRNLLNPWWPVSGGSKGRNQWPGNGGGRGGSRPSNFGKHCPLALWRAWKEVSWKSLLPSGGGTTLPNPGEEGGGERAPLTAWFFPCYAQVSMLKSPIQEGHGACVVPVPLVP